MSCASKLTSSLRDSDPGFIQVNDFLFRAGLVTSPGFKGEGRHSDRGCLNTIWKKRTITQILFVRKGGGGGDI